MKLNINFRRTAKVAAIALCAVLAWDLAIDRGSTALAKKGGNGNGGGGGSGSARYYIVEISGELKWQDEDTGNIPTGRIGRLDSEFSENFIVNLVAPEGCATKASMNLNFLGTLDGIDTCLPQNVGSDRVYGGTLIGVTNAEGMPHVHLNIPDSDAFDKSGKSRSYRLDFTVDSTPFDLIAALRDLLAEQSLILSLSGWELTPGKGKPGLGCSGSGNFTTASIKFTAVRNDDDPCADLNN